MGTSTRARWAVAVVLAVACAAPPSSAAIPVLIQPPQVGSTSATVTADVDPGGIDTDCHVDYGVTTLYGAQAPCTPRPGDANGPVRVSALLTNLTPSTGYHYRFVLVTSGGNTNAPDETFVTLPAASPPTIADSTIARIARPMATGRAAVNPNGSDTECHFVDFSGASIPCTPQPGAGTSPVTVEAAIPVHGPFIVFQVVATNAGGTVVGPRQAMAVLWTNGNWPLFPRLTSLTAGKRTATSVTLKLTCAGAPEARCRGKVGLTASLRRHHYKLGAASFDIPAGRTTQVDVPLSRRARRLVRARHRLTAIATAAGLTAKFRLR